MASTAQHKTRSQRGAFLVEQPLVLWILFVLFLVPFIDIAAMTTRYTFVVTASRDAVHSAAHARSFQSDIAAGELSAMNAARDTAIRTGNSFSEITINSVTTRIVITNLTTRAKTYSNVRLATPADTNTNLYEIETVVNATLRPLITFNMGPMSNVPGLSAPIVVNIASREYSENPQGLNI